eukprot:7886201-Pyramimonas_sp.AAC.1
MSWSWGTAQGSRTRFPRDPSTLMFRGGKGMYGCRCSSWRPLVATAGFSSESWPECAWERSTE